MVPVEGTSIIFRWLSRGFGLDLGVLRGIILVPDERFIIVGA